MKKILSLLACCALHAAGAQTLDRMQWFNEPERWSIDDDRLTIYATPHSDYWRISHYGFTVDDGPFCYATYGGEFEAKVRIDGDYRTRFDQAGLMLRIDAERWIKAGIEYVDGRYHLSCVVTDGRSDWSVIALDRPVETVWIKAVRRLDAVEIYYSFDDDTYTMMRNAPFRDRIPVQVGMMAASPDGDGFEARFDGFRVTHLPDLRRTEWLERHAAE
ncbi:DUF1349 domain-containing protein [Alistipes sp.]|uniref:DUF1349 domain-containing protein n=1 Tax=Alistipes sp. TaxID=1872444 RepID=UPI000E8FE74E|nr:DUF1349 domain-containing protein [Alistipes sp.]HBX90232.1 DUF1349 domain-containing protein [Alistipes sp.]